MARQGDLVVTDRNF